MTITTIILQSDDISPVLISGLIVRAFTTGGTFVTSGTTDGSGQVIFDLPDADYDLTFYKVGVSPNSGQPQRITVNAADTDVPPNTFKVIAHVTSMPESSDPLLCMISGTILGSNGISSHDLRMMAQMCPTTAVLSSLIIAPNQMIDIIPDDNGYYEFTLLRGMRYEVFFPQLLDLFGTSPAKVDCYVPNLPALPLTDFLFPIPRTATFATTTLALTVPDGNTDVLTTVTYSDGSVNQGGVRQTPPFFTSLSAVSDDITVAIVSFIADRVIVTPVAAGTAHITVTRTVNPNMLPYLPLPSFTTQTLTVTVS